MSEPATSEPTESELLLHGEYQATTGTGWNRPGSWIRPGEQGLVGDWWAALGVKVNFGDTTHISAVVNDFGEPATISISADGSHWTPIATVPHGRTAVDIDTTYIKLDWQQTSKTLNGQGKTVGFYGYLCPGRTLRYEFQWAAGDPCIQEPFEDIPEQWREGFNYSHVGEGTLLSAHGGEYYHVIQYKQLGKSVEEVKRLLESACSSHENCVGFHINPQEGNGRYLEGAVLLDRKVSTRTRAMPEAFQAAGAKLSWDGFAEGSEQGAPSLERASKAAGKGWETWQAYARVDERPTIVVTLHPRGSGLDCLGLSGEALASVELPEGGDTLAEVRRKVAEKLSMPEALLRLSMPSAELLTEENFGSHLSALLASHHEADV